MVHGYGGYTTNVPLEDLLDGKAWIAYRFDGDDLAPEHGGPARMLIPHLYFWKSAKWVNGIEMIERRTSRASGKRPATTCTETHGASSGIRATDLAGRHGGRVSGTRRPSARTLVLDLPDWPGHLPGQHVDVRLTAPDGYSRRAQLLDRVGAGPAAARSS